MANLTSILTVRLIDAVTAPARAAANSIRGIGTAVDQTNARRLAVGGAVNTMVKDVNKGVQNLQRNFNRMTSGLSMPAGFMTFFGARSVYNFEKMSNKLEAVTGMTAAQKEEIQSYAKELNALFPFTNEQIMSAAFELGRAGFKFEQIMGSLKDTLNISLAGDIEVQEASDIATNVLTAMRLPMKTQEQAADSLRRVNDALAYVAANSNTDVRMMGETFKYVGPMAAAAGLDIERVAAASMVMAQNGIRGSEAGVAMRSALVRLAGPTKKGYAALARLNIDIRDFVDNTRQISGIDIANSLLADGVDATPMVNEINKLINDPKLRKSLSGLSQAITDLIAPDGSVVDRQALTESVRDALTAAGSNYDLLGFVRALRERGATMSGIRDIFDQRQGARLITLLAGNLDERYAEISKNAPGSTDKMAKTMMQGVVGDWAAFVASIENLFLAIAESGVLKTATEMIKATTNGLKSLAESNPKMLEFATYALLIAAALGPIAIVGGGVISFFLSLVSLLALAARFGKGALAVTGAALGATGATAGAAGAGTAAAGAAAGAGAAAKGGSFFGRLLRGAGIIGAAVTAKEVLDLIDPKGNLWGLTSGIDAWMESKTGINPSNIGGKRERIGPEATPEEGRAHDLAQWQARQAEIDARLAQIEKNMHPAMRDMPNIERDNLQAERGLLEQQIKDATPPGDPAGGAAAANETMDAFKAAFAEQSAQVKAAAQELARDMQAILSTTITPTIRPKVDMSGISGVHADTGVD